MRKTTKIFLLVSFLILSFFPISNVKAVEIVSTDSFIIKSNSPQDTEDKIKELGISSFKEIEQLNTYSVTVDKRESEFVKNALAHDSSSVYVEENQKTRISATPNDPYFNYQTYLQSSDVVNAWDTNGGSQNIIVAVIDTGVDYLHEDLKNKMWKDSNGFYGYDFVNDDTDPMDDNGHGTFVAGVIAAEKGNGVGIAGIANVKVMSAKAVPADGEGDVIDLADAIVYVADSGARVANVSLGLPEESKVLDDAIIYAKKKGCLIIAATGNGYSSLVDNPARNPNAIGVGALNASGYRASYANYGAGIGISALGNGIYSTSWSSSNATDLYEYGNGTSFATPQVTATAALILSKDPSLSVDQLKKRVLSSAKKLPAMGNAIYSNEYGYGKLDTANALSYDSTSPTATLGIYKTTAGTFYIRGNVSDDNNSSAIMPEVPDSNIGTVRYQIDDSSWVVLSSFPVKILNVSLEIPALSPINHNITVESLDTAGNKKTTILSTGDATFSTISSNLADYRYELIEQSSFVSTSAGGTSKLSLALKNVGNSTWDKNKFHLGTTHPTDRNSAFSDVTWLSSNRIAMQEDTVPVGGLAHFDFNVKVPNGTTGVFKEYFSPVAEGVGWLNDIGIYWQINVESISYHALLMNQSAYSAIKKGENATLWVEYKNVGSTDWTYDVVNLGTSNPQDRYSVFYTPRKSGGWKSVSRIGMDKDVVKPGETARFTFTAHAPFKTGTYYEYFRPVAEGITWMEDYGLFWKIEVK